MKNVNASKGLDVLDCNNLRKYLLKYITVKPLYQDYLLVWKKNVLLEGGLISELKEQTLNIHQSVSMWSLYHGGFFIKGGFTA